MQTFILPPGTESNPFHVKELTETEFRTTLSGSFQKVELIRQRAVSGSAIVPDTTAPGTNSPSIFERRDALTYEAASGLPSRPLSPGRRLRPCAARRWRLARSSKKTTRLSYGQRRKNPSGVGPADPSRGATREGNCRIGAGKTAIPDIDLRAAVEKAHSEWTQRARTEEALAATRLETETLRAALRKRQRRAH